MKLKSTIKCWAEDDRPREKMLLKGKSVLSDAELLAILLGSGTKELSAVELAQQILAAAENDLYRFGKFSIADLKKFKGVGEAKAITLQAAIELGRRRKEAEPTKRTKVTSSVQVYEHLKSRMSDLMHEEFYILLLNRSNEIMATTLISSGGMSGTVADGKIIFKKALEMQSHAIILAHNHPSGQLKPSTADTQLTKKMVEFGKMIDLPILDHLIFTDYGYFSFADEGMIF